MDRVTTTLIDLAEAAYDFESRDSEWLPGILASGRPLLDHGLGVAGGIFARSRDGRERVLRELHLIAVPERCARRLTRIAAGIPHSGARSGICMTLSEAVGETHALASAGWASLGGRASDALGLWATDASGRRRGHHRATLPTDEIKHEHPTPITAIPKQPVSTATPDTESKNLSIATPTNPVLQAKSSPPKRY